MARHLFTALALLAALGFASLGIWQLERRAWKLDLIARTERNLHTTPVAAPATATPAQTYTRVIATGRFMHEAETLVLAVTSLGRGYWVLTPLQTTSGTMILINRGFVPPDRQNPATRPYSQPHGIVTVTGLLRLTEPGGAFLRTNNPATGKWFSRDVAAIAAALHLSPVAPYFIDADTAPAPGALPVGGLTVVAFRNSHLVYALTWFTLALMSLAAALTLWLPHRLRQK